MSWRSIAEQYYARIAELEAEIAQLRRPGNAAERYWEARWRDEKAENDRLKAALAPVPSPPAEEPPVPPDGWREGAEAMREVCEIAAATWLEKRGPYGNDTRRASISLAAALRALPIPSPPAEETKP